jgi:class 3 adenylate cyclase
MYEASLVYRRGETGEITVPFHRQIVVGRPPGPNTPSEAHMPIDEPTVSRRHCVVRQSSRGEFFVRDESTNGTRVDGRRLLPKIEIRIDHQATIEVAEGHSVILEIGKVADQAWSGPATFGATRLAGPDETEVAVLVGDIAGYTTLTRQFSATDVTASVKRVFAELEPMITEFRGMVKEYQGDAVFAFWEFDASAPNQHVAQACRCALALRERVTLLAEDADAWTFGDEFPLIMEWAITTGVVAISPMGRERPGLNMVGDVVNYAFRLEKLAGEQYGTILVSQSTEARVRDVFDLRSIGEHSVEGRSQETVFSLAGLKAFRAT